jgi:hypothetical protein
MERVPYNRGSISNGSGSSNNSSSVYISSKHEHVYLKGFKFCESAAKIEI